MEKKGFLQAAWDRSASRMDELLHKEPKGINPLRAMWFAIRAFPHAVGMIATHVVADITKTDIDYQKDYQNWKKQGAAKPGKKKGEHLLKDR